MNSRQRAYLRSLASSLTPAFQLGKETLTPEFCNSVREGFNTKELVKINVLKNCPVEIKETANLLAERTGSQLVEVIGRKIVLYKENKDNKKIELPL